MTAASSSRRSHCATTTSSATKLLLLLLLLPPPLLLLLGASAFTKSFFLSRTPFEERSSCAANSAGDLLRDSLGLEDEYVSFLRGEGMLSDGGGGDDDDPLGGRLGGAARGSSGGTGCWTPRSVDSLVILVVDALRFDFARDRLPLSVGSRLFPNVTSSATAATSQSQSAKRSSKKAAAAAVGGTSRLYRFVADPPTVTMQRLKGLTTGGLPTFADITGSFGGADVHEDSWLEQLKTAPWSRRTTGPPSPERPRTAFVGDDTWVDLFPDAFDDCHPFPSFNTRDLDTVDDGCLRHLPRLLDGLSGLEGSGEGGGRGTGAAGDDDGTTTPPFELVIAHFLGVDHVGHTYGPNDRHMEAKLRQVDEALSRALDAIDSTPSSTSCVAAFVLGDHGMTEDGNHGGGTDEEVSAGLFAHYSPGCRRRAGGSTTAAEEEFDASWGDARHSEAADVPGAARAFDSVHQIDLVPTISFLMGLPVPYANIGGVVPDLLPPPPPPPLRGDGGVDGRPSPSSHLRADPSPRVAVALALNAAQVWGYLDAYSKASRDLPADGLGELKELLDSATSLLRDAMSLSMERARRVGGADVEGRGSDGEGIVEEGEYDYAPYRQACGLFKLFLAESTGLGKRVWTQFDERGMAMGIAILVVAWIAAFPLWKRSAREDFTSAFVVARGKKADDGDEDEKRRGPPASSSVNSYQRLEIAAAVAFMAFYCGALTFSNSYIENEREIVTMFLSVLCLLVFRRWYAVSSAFAPSYAGGSLYLPLMVAACSRMNDVFATGHGLDPSLGLHAAHHPAVFIPSLLLLAVLRLRWLGGSSKDSCDNGAILRASQFVPLFDIIAIISLGASWWEKHTVDQTRNGFLWARSAMLSVILGFSISLVDLAKLPKQAQHKCCLQQLILFRAMLFLVIVTGPSAAFTAVLVTIQCVALRWMMNSAGARIIAAPVTAAIWRLAIRHAFFATNHHCSFNRLQFSAAFVASDTFRFYIAGSSLFMNTFGYEILGSCLVLLYSKADSKSTSNALIWDWFRYFQCTEMLASCLSVSVMKRHLMVWAIFAPRFMFAAVFTAVGLFLWVLDVLMELSA